MLVVLLQVLMDLLLAVPRLSLRRPYFNPEAELVRHASQPASQLTDGVFDGS